MDLKVFKIIVFVFKIGIGAMYIRSKPRIRMIPLINGGGQERGLRSGTLPVPLVVGFGSAAQLAQEHMNVNHLNLFK